MTEFSNGAASGADGRFEGYASVFNVVDGGNDLVLPGAFRTSIRERGPRGIKLLWQHDPREPVGVIEEISEDNYGLLVRGRLLKDVRRASEAWGLMKSGALDGLSIGFHAVTADRRADGRRVLKKVDLWEVSLVTFPMNDRARVLALKGEKSCPQSGPVAAQAGLLAAMHHLGKLMTQER